jgi:hypothetical protein
VIVIEKVHEDNLLILASFVLLHKTNTHLAIFSKALSVIGQNTSTTYSFSWLYLGCIK